MPKFSKEELTAVCCRSNKAPIRGECTIISASNNVDYYERGIAVKDTGYQTPRRINDGYGSGLDSGEMGCSQSSDLPPVGSFCDGGEQKDDNTVLEDPARAAKSPNKKIEKTDSSESCSGDEDPTTRAVDQKGRQTASNADLINVQRSEKTDTWVLEDRWLRSHFSGTKGTATLPVAVDEISASQDMTLPSISVAEFESAQLSDLKKRRSDLFDGVTDLHIKKSLDCVTVSSGGQIDSVRPESVNNRLSILHFNDVYELTEGRKEPVGGAARFSTLFEEVFQKAKRENNGEKPFIAFGGDCLNPSILSSATKGKHMIEVLNHLKVNAAVFGNHEFDFGVEHAAACISNMKFPWFLSNVTDKFTGKPLADGVTSEIIHWHGIKIGVMGLIEEEWLDTLATVDKWELEFEDYVTRGNELCEKLKHDGAEIVIALTHMRWPNDIRLAQEVKNIDLILGGHDHEYGVRLVDDCVIVKSGCDFQTFSMVDLYLKKDGDIDISVTRYDVTTATKPDAEMKSIVDRYMTVLEKQLQETIGVTRTPLNGLYKDVRSRETNLGNFVSDIMRMTTRAEIVLINSGTFRSNAEHKSGDFHVRDLMSILPIHDNVVVIEVTGQQLLDGLENSVCKYPRREGRFPQISGFSFGFDPKAKPKDRVLPESVIIQGKVVELDRVYKLATKAYVARGKDGYDCFTSCNLLNDPDSGPVLSTVIRNHISNVGRLLEHEERTGYKIKVSDDGKKITSTCGNLHEVHSYCFTEEDAPIHKLQQSMEEIVPKDVDINGNERRVDCKRAKRADTDRCTEHHRQHLVEICRDDIFDKAAKTTSHVMKHRRKAIESNKKNLALLQERQKTSADVRWQVLPLLEGRIYICPKTK